MAINFPASPTQGQTFAAGGYQYIYIDGVWRVVEASQNLTALPRNRLVNGSAQISQENGTTGSAVAVSNSAYYMADQWPARWSLASGGSVAAASSASVLSPNGTKTLVTYVGVAQASLAAGDYISWLQIVEGIRIADFLWGTANAKQVVLRFWARADTAGTYSARLFNSAQDRSYVATWTVTAAQTWQQFVLVIPGDTAGTWLTTTGIGVGVEFVRAVGANRVGVAGWQAGDKWGVAGQTNGAAVASNNFYIADVGLYLDPLNTGVPPRFEMPDEAQEIIACCRYWEKVSTSTWVSAYPTRPWAAPKRVQAALSLVLESGSGATATQFSGMAAGGTLFGFYLSNNSAPSQATVIGNAKDVTMPYVSARYAPPPPPEMAMMRSPGDPKQVIATDDQNVEWWLDEASQVGDWLRYIENGGTIDPYLAPKTAKKEKTK